MTHEDKASYDSTPLCTVTPSFVMTDNLSSFMNLFMHSRIARATTATQSFTTLLCGCNSSTKSTAGTYVCRCVYVCVCVCVCMCVCVCVWKGEGGRGDLCLAHSIVVSHALVSHAMHVRMRDAALQRHSLLLHARIASCHAQA